MCVRCFLARLFSPRMHRIVASTPAVAEKNISRVNLAYILAKPCVSGQKTVRYESIVVPAAYACLQLKWSAWEVYVHDLWNCCHPVGTVATSSVLSRGHVTRNTCLCFLECRATQEIKNRANQRERGREKVKRGAQGRHPLVEPRVWSILQPQPRRVPISDGFLMSA